MSRPRFLADHDLNEHIVTGLPRREPAVEFFRVRESGLSEEPDDAVLDYAAREHLLVVSHDVNTMPAAAYSRLAVRKPFRGLFMAPQTAPIRPVIEDLILVWCGTESEEWENPVVFLPLG